MTSRDGCMMRPLDEDEPRRRRDGKLATRMKSAERQREADSLKTVRRSRHFKLDAFGNRRRRWLMFAELGRPGIIHVMQRLARTKDGTEDTLECLSESRCHSLYIQHERVLLPAYLSLMVAVTAERFETHEIQRSWPTRAQYHRHQRYLCERNII